MDLKDYQPHTLLVRLRASLGHVIYVRVQPSLVKLELALFQAVYAENRFAASEVLCDLSVLVADVQQTYGWLPDEMAEDVRELVSGILDVFRDPLFNPAGALNEHSLRRLEAATVENLRRASSLHSLGLELAA